MGQVERRVDLQGCGDLIRLCCCRSGQCNRRPFTHALDLLLLASTATESSSKRPFLLPLDSRTPSVIKNLHGLRGSKHRLAIHPVSCRSRLSVRYWTNPLVHGWDKQEVERIAGFGYARQGTSRSDPCGAEVATTLGEVMSKKKEYV